MITVVVEGETDVPFVRKLCAHAGFRTHEPVISAGGKSGIDPNLPKWADAAKASPYLVVRDLDHDAECAGEWIATHAPSNPGSWFCLRLAVREVEAWFLADAETAAKRLHVMAHAVPADPDKEADAKGAVLALARRSSKRYIREGIPPRRGESRKIGPLYQEWLIESGHVWNVEKAIERSDSLARAHRALCTLRKKYQAFVEGR